MTRTVHRPAPWAGWSLMAGGAAMATLWLIFTVSHGPTSFNENNPVLGRGMHFWGMLLGVLPNVLVAAGLLALRSRIVTGARGAATIGYVLALVALFGSASVDLAMQALGPPLLMPIQGLGLVMVGLAPGESPGRRQPDIRRPLLVIGILLLAAFSLALVPLEVSDSFGGYRLFGAIAHLAVGAGWIVAGLRAGTPPAETA